MSGRGWLSTYPKTRAACALGLLLLIAIPGLRAQSTSPTSAETPETVTLEHISARLEGLETSTTIEPEIRDAAINLFRDAQFQVELSRSHARTAREYQAVLDSAPSQLERIHAELSGALEQSVDLGLSENAETPEIENRLAQVQVDEAALANERDREGRR